MMKAVFAEIVRYFSGVGGIRKSDFIGKDKCRLLFGLSGSLLASQKLSFLRKLRFNFVEAALSDGLKSGYPFHRP